MPHAKVQQGGAACEARGQADRLPRAGVPRQWMPNRRRPPPDSLSPQDKLGVMKWTVLLFLCSLIAALFGFGGLAASAAAGVAKGLFVVFLLLAACSVMAGERLLR